MTRNKNTPRFKLVVVRCIREKDRKHAQDKKKGGLTTMVRGKNKNKKKKNKTNTHSHGILDILERSM